MKFFRFLLTCLIVIATCAVIAVLVVIAPTVQTWVAQRALSGIPGSKGSLDSISAGFGEIDVENLRYAGNGAVLTLPSLKAKLSLSEAVLRRQFHVRSLVAKGWSLDLSNSDAAQGIQAAVSATSASGGIVTQASPADVQKAARDILGVLSQWKLPFNGSLDGVDMEGEVIFLPFPGKAPARVHIVLGGGGISAGHEGVLTFDASATIADTSLPVSTASAHGQLAVSMDGQQTLNHFRLEADVSDNGNSALSSLALAAEATRDGKANVVSYRVEVSRSGRHLATVAVALPDASRQLDGTWAVDLRDTDLSQYFPDHPLPSMSLVGAGQFDADTGFAKLHLRGRLESDASHLDAAVPALAGVGAVKLGGSFEATRTGHLIRVHSLDIALSAAHPVAKLRSVQSFDLDDRTGSLTASDPGGDLFDVTVSGLPLAWLPGFAGGTTVAGGDAAGEFFVSKASGGYSMLTRTPAVASAVSLVNGGKVLAKELDLNLSLTAQVGSGSWQLGCSPLNIDSHGRRVAAIEATAKRPDGTDSAISLDGKWEADLDTIAAAHAVPAAAWLSGRSASGSFSASFAASTRVDGSLAVVGHDAAHSFSASAHADIDAGGGATFQAPVKFTYGTSVSEVSLDGTCGMDGGLPWVDLTMKSADVAFEDLGELAAPFSSSGGAASGVRDEVPFWGGLTGRVAVSFDRLRGKEGEFVNVGGTFDIEKGSIQLEGGHVGPTGKILTNIQGSVGFVAGSDFPYTLKGTAAGTDLEASSFFPKPRTGEYTMFEGKFTLARAFSGKGLNLYDLVAHSQEEFHITSTSGIAHLLNANVADSLTEASNGAVSNALSTVGSTVGSVMGTKSNILDTGKTKLSTNTQAVLDLTYQVSEIGYDSVDVTAVRGLDGPIHLVQMEMITPELRLKGTGQISNAKGVPLLAQALSADLQLGAQGEDGDILSKAGLLSPDKDELGYTNLKQALHFGGTLARVDSSQWNDLLVKAAIPKVEAPKKD